MGVLLVILSMTILQVSAWSDEREYTDNTPYEMYGNWDSSDEEAQESFYGLAYRCVIVFQFYNVLQTGDSYKVHIDYDGVSPGYPWNYENLFVEYRWGSGSWIWIATLSMWAGDTMIDIADATSSTCEVRIVDSNTFLDATQHTWYFGAEPSLWVYWD